MHREVLPHEIGLLCWAEPTMVRTSDRGSTLALVAAAWQPLAQGMWVRFCDNAPAMFARLDPAEQETQLPPARPTGPGFGQPRPTGSCFRGATMSLYWDPGDASTFNPTMPKDTPSYPERSSRGLTRSPGRQQRECAFSSEQFGRNREAP